MEWIYGIDWGGVIKGVIIVLVVYAFVKGTAMEAVSRWVRENVSPGVGGQRSIVFPRVWTFTPKWSKTLVEELSVPSEESEIARTLGLGPIGDTSHLLSGLVIEEYATHIRFHQWFYPSEEEDSYHTPYEWFDILHQDFILFGPKKDEELWSFSTEQMTSALRLSCAWEEGADKKRVYLKLSASVRRESEDGEILYQIPLDPGLLDDERGKTVFDERDKERKASEVLPYPYNEGSWKAESGEGADWRWSWYLKMQTFDRSIRWRARR